MPAVGEEERRAQALASLKKRVEFRSHLIAFVLINSVIVVIWAVTGAHFFWPIFPILGWGVGLVLHGVDVYSRGPTEAQIRREMDRLG